MRKRAVGPTFTPPLGGVMGKASKPGPKPVRDVLGPEFFGGGGCGGALDPDPRRWPALGSWMLSRQLKRKRGATISPAQLRRGAADENNAPANLRKFMDAEDLVLVEVGDDRLKFATRPQMPTIVEESTVDTSA